jgi:hypothetical protein
MKTVIRKSVIGYQFVIGGAKKSRTKTLCGKGQKGFNNSKLVNYR